MSRSTSRSTANGGKKQIVLRLRKPVRKQLKRLSRTTRRSPEELVEILIASPLSQIVEQADTDLMQMVLE